MTTIAIIAPGAMGSAVAVRLIEHGATVLTSLAGRSPATRARAQAAGMLDASDEQLAAADLLLSILPPGAALALAERLAPALARSPRPPVFVDCNAVNVGTVQKIAGVIGANRTRFVDAGIIGLPPVPGQPGPTFYLAGEAAADLAWLERRGLRIRILDGPIGAAKALKMSYAGITKGLTAIAAAMVLAAGRHGAAAALRQELAASQPQLLKRFSTGLPDMLPKAYRWVAEMREIAGFVAADGAAAQVYQGFADFYQRLAEDAAGAHGQVDLIEAFLGLAEPSDPSA